jgi:hypothetical protein
MSDAPLLLAVLLAAAAARLVLLEDLAVELDGGTAVAQAVPQLRLQLQRRHTGGVGDRPQRAQRLLQSAQAVQAVCLRGRRAWLSGGQPGGGRLLERWVPARRGPC